MNYLRLLVSYRNNTGLFLIYSLYKSPELLAAEFR